MSNSIKSLAERHLEPSKLEVRMESISTAWRRAVAKGFPFEKFHKNRDLTELETEFVLGLLLKDGSAKSDSKVDGTLFTTTAVTTSAAKPVETDSKTVAAIEKETMKLRKEHNATIKAIEANHADAIQVLQVAFNADLASANADLETLRSEMEKQLLDQKNEAFRNQNNANARHRNAIDKLENEIARLRAQNASDLAEQKKAFEQVLGEVKNSQKGLLDLTKSSSSTLQADFAQTLARKNAEHQIALNDITKSFQQQLDAKNEAIAEIKRSAAEAIATLKEQQAATIADMSATYKKQLSSKSGGLSELQESHDKVINELKASHQRILIQKDQDLADSEAKHAKNLADAKSDYGLKIGAANVKFAQFEAQSNAKIAELTALLAASDAKWQNLQENFEAERGTRASQIKDFVFRYQGTLTVLAPLAVFAGLVVGYDEYLAFADGFKALKLPMAGIAALVMAVFFQGFLMERVGETCTRIWLLGRKVDATRSETIMENISMGFGWTAVLFMIYTAFHVYRNADATEPIENVAEIRRIEKQFSKDSASIMANWKSDTTRLGDSVNLVISKREIAISEKGKTWEDKSKLRAENATTLLTQKARLNEIAPAPALQKARNIKEAALKTVKPIEQANNAIIALLVYVSLVFVRIVYLMASAIKDKEQVDLKPRRLRVIIREFFAEIGKRI